MAYVDEWMHQAGHESGKHLRLSRCISTIEVGALRIEIFLQRFVNSLGEELVGEEDEVRLIVPRVAEMINKVVLCDLHRRLSDRTLILSIVLVPITEEFFAPAHSVNPKHVVDDMTVGVGRIPYVRNQFYPTRTERPGNLLDVPQVVEEDVVVPMVVLQDLEQGFLSLGAAPGECAGAQQRRRILRR